MIYAVFLLLAFSCFYYANDLICGIVLILLPLLITYVVLAYIYDIENAYVEIKNGENIVVDYYFGIKKEKRFLLGDITSAKIAFGYSHKVRGKRVNTVGTQYIIFYNNQKYLFKIIYLAQTAEIFGEYLNLT